MQLRGAGSPPTPRGAPPRSEGPSRSRPRSPADLDIPLSELPLRLLVTVVADNPAASLATVADVEHHTSAVMREGQRFEGRPSVRLTAIERARVLIDNDGVREQLVLLRADAAPERAQAGDISFEEREYRRDLARRLRALTDPRRCAGPGDGGDCWLRVTSAPPIKVGRDGVQIDGVRAGGLYGRSGSAAESRDRHRRRVARTRTPWCR